MAGPAGPTEAERAQRTLNLSIAGGLFLQLVAVLVVAVAATKHGELVVEGGVARHEGSPWGVSFGVLIGSVGALFVLLGVIGWGVVLGLRAARRP
ncbi:hypothetical protein [Nocardioides campestrisoli]|uniref:hypothetical protein n=1 Tax=Nocardioides campestrisoli TaxID=2736757 RepID=UPI0015E743D3|nr:hypothetical protein [Nocardioides campestrisoli]